MCGISISSVTKWVDNYKVWSTVPSEGILLCYFLNVIGNLLVSSSTLVCMFIRKNSVQWSELPAFSILRVTILIREYALLKSVSPWIINVSTLMPYIIYHLRIRRQQTYYDAAVTNGTVSIGYGSRRNSGNNFLTLNNGICWNDSIDHYELILHKYWRL